MIINYYRYDSGSKDFKVITAKKTFSLGVDAVAIFPQSLKNQKIV